MASTTITNINGDLLVDLTKEVFLVNGSKFWSATIDDKKVSMQAGNVRKGQVLEKTVTKLSKDLKDNKEAQNYLHQKIVVKFLRGYYIEGNRHAPSLEIKKRAQKAISNQMSGQNQANIAEQALRSSIKPEEDKWLETVIDRFDGIYLARATGSKREFHLIEVFEDWVRYSSGNESDYANANVELEQYPSAKEAQKRAYQLQQDLLYQDFQEQSQNYNNTLCQQEIAEMRKGKDWKPCRPSKEQRDQNVQAARNRGRFNNISNQLMVPGAVVPDQADRGRSASNNRGLSVDTDRAASRSPSPMVDREEKKSTQKEEVGEGKANLKLFGAPANKASDVMLAKVWDDNNVNPKGWLMSEKLDGMRMYWTGTQMFSRNGVQILFPEYFVKNWPNSQLDGELWISRDSFQQLMRIVKKQQTCLEEDWKNVTYMVYDAPGINKPFQDRIKVVMEQIPQLNSPYIKAVPHVACEDLDHLQRELDVILQNKGEGIMLQSPDCMYEKIRSDKLLQVKVFEDAQATVIGHTVSTQRADLFGALEVRNDQGIEFQIGSGFTDEQRKSRQFPKGTVVTFQHQGISEGGKPRFPIFLRQKIAE